MTVSEAVATRVVPVEEAVRRPTRSWFRAGVTVLGLGLLLPVGAGPAVPVGTPVTAGVGERPFAPTSPFNRPAGPVVPEPGRATLGAATLRDRIAEQGVVAGLVEFGIPIYTATTTTPRHTITCAMQPAWGTCPFTGRTIPIPTNARPHTGSDGAMVVIDPTTRTAYEFWQATSTTRNGKTTWTTSWGSVSSLDGNGWTSTATGSGASRLAGVIRLQEIKDQRIDHALALQSDNVCAKTYLPPATKTDGQSTRADCLPEGTHVQLDPTLDLTTLTLRPAELTIARALQTHGAYIIDKGSAPLSISFELDPTATPTTTGTTYTNAGLRWDYDNLTGIPWNGLRVTDPAQEQS